MRTDRVGNAIIMDNIGRIWEQIDKCKHNKINLSGRRQNGEGLQMLRIYPGYLWALTDCCEAVSSEDISRLLEDMDKCSNVVNNMDNSRFQGDTDRMAKCSKQCG